MAKYKVIPGGVCAAKGFSASGVHAGFRANPNKLDLAIIKADVRCAAAGVYTTNKVYGAPIKVDRAHLVDGHAQAVLVNSGNANTCAANGVDLANECCALVAQQLGIAAEDVLPASTGVIGQRINIECIEEHLSEIVLSDDASEQANRAIMTTDTRTKTAAVEFTVGGKTCRIGGICKGSGMIHPNMATMLFFITTDAAISSEMLQKAVSTDVQNTFNMISVDGDTSTNDMVAVLANGLAGNAEITAPGADFTAFCSALNSVTVWLCRQIAGDGEGATRLLECCVTGAADHGTAKTVAKSIICSSLVKAAMFGADANWGRVLCAIGYSGTHVDVHKVDVFFRSAAGTVCVCTHGAGVPFSEEEAKQILLEKEIEILVDLNAGDEGATAWGCDLTYDYVKINGDYRT